jgi:hypothetical protein
VELELWGEASSEEEGNGVFVCVCVCVCVCGGGGGGVRTSEAEAIPLQATHCVLRFAFTAHPLPGAAAPSPAGHRPPSVVSQDAQPPVTESIT